MDYSDVPPSSYFETNPVQTPLYHAYPTLVQYTNVIIIILLIEFALLFLGLILIVFFKMFFDRRESKLINKLDSLKNKLLHCLHFQKKFSLDMISGYPLSLLLAAVEAVDATVVDARWNEIKKEIMQKKLLPKARVWVKKRSWFKRVMAARCFAFCPLKEDEPSILKLVKDPVPMVQYCAIDGAAKLASNESTDVILTAMSSATRFARFPLRDALKRCDAQTFAHIENKFSQQLSSYEKVSCLEALDFRVYHNIYSSLEKQLYDPHKNLRLSVIRVLGNYPTQECAHRLLQLLDDSEWEIRAIAASSLGRIGWTGAIPKLMELLNDKMWWVRANAANALKKMGENGIKALKMQDPEIDKFAFDIARYVL